MYRYPCYLFEDEKIIDSDCIVGYDNKMDTLFFRSGKLDKHGNPLFWLGKEKGEFKTLTALQLYLSNKGYLLLINENDRKSLLEKLPNYRLDLMDLLREFKHELIKQKDFINLVIIPIGRLEIGNKIEINEFNMERYKLFPPRSLNIADILSNIYFRDRENWISIYENHSLLIFVMNKEIEYPFGADEDDEYFSACINKANFLLDIIKYLYCRYDRPQTHPSPPGITESGIATMINYTPALKVPRFYCKKISTHYITVGRGLKIAEPVIKNHYAHIFGDINEVGQVLKQALKLNRIIFATDDATMKFTQIMSLLDFLAFPKDYESFSKAKNKLITHIARNVHEFEQLQTRFLELTGKTETNPEGEKVHTGIRTQIVHLGRTLEQILLCKFKIKHLFKELQRYIYLIFEDMFHCAHLTWEEFENFRKIQQNEIFKSNEPVEDTNLANTAMFVDINYLNKTIRRVIKSYQELYPKKNFPHLTFERLFAHLCRNGRAIEPNALIPIICIRSPNEKIIHCDNGDLDLYKNTLFASEETIYQTIVIDSQNVPHDLINEVQNFSQDGNAISSLHGQFTKFIICADESDLYNNYFSEFDNETYETFFIRNDNHRTSFSETISSLWVHIDEAIAFSLGLQRDEL